MILTEITAGRKILRRSWTENLGGLRVQRIRSSEKMAEILKSFWSVKRFWWRRGVLFIQIFQARFGRSRLDEKIRSCGWDLIPILGGKVRIGTDASFNTEGTWTVHYSSVYYRPLEHDTSRINPRKSGNSYSSDATQECQKSPSPRIRDNTFEGAKCSTHFPRLTRLGQWTPRVTNSED